MTLVEPQWGAVCRICELAVDDRCRYCPTRSSAVHRATWEFTKRWKLTLSYVGILATIVGTLTVVRI